MTNDKVDRRSPEQIREHYEIEKSLARRLRDSDRSERGTLYGSLYNELFSRVPHHPQNRRKADPEEAAVKAVHDLRRFRDRLGMDKVFLEIGAGDCTLSRAVAEHVERVIAIDVSDKIADSAEPPENFELIVSDGIEIPVEPDSVDFAYSDQLLEHLHPQDVLEQTTAVHTALRKNGKYMCITPHRYRGPLDISGRFDDVATGFHLKEYTIAELERLFRQVGFSDVQVFVRILKRQFHVSAAPVVLLERLIGLLPARARRALLRRPPFRQLFYINVVGIR